VVTQIIQFVIKVLDFGTQILKGFTLVVHWKREAIHPQQKSIRFFQLCLSLCSPGREVSLLYFLGKYRNLFD
jgi:hypothetical protein